MIRLTRRVIPAELRERKKEILGEVRGITMVDCVYNALLAGELTPVEPVSNPQEYLPDFLKDYQVEDLSKSLALNQVFNINKPGYGKTLETIMWIKVVLKKDFKALILCPKSVITTWTNQLNKYWPGWASDGMWWITNYEQLYDEQRQSIAKEIFWDVIVLDESHTIKSFKSKITQICFQLKSHNRHCLTGTPIKNRPEDLAAQLKWLDPFSITNYTDFQNMFCHLETDAWGVKPRGLTKNLQIRENLQRLLDRYCVGGEEHDIGAIEKPEYIKVRLKLPKRVRALYTKIEGEWNPELGKKVVDTQGLMEQGIKVSNAIEAATRRQQLASNCQLFDETLTNVKFEWIHDWLQGTDEKVVIFSKYAKTIDYLEKFLKSKKHSLVTVRRQDSVAMRANKISQWSKRAQVLLGTTGVLGTGVDGMQDVSCYGIFVDREWTASDNEQAEKRLYRTGQKRKVFFYILQAMGTIDVRIERVQLNKGLDAAALLEPVQEESPLD